MKNKSIIGAAGEHHVITQLLRRGWIASLAPYGAQNVDILVTDKNSKTRFNIQVKTHRGRFTKSSGWPMKPKHETIIADALFYVFVDLGEQSTDPINSYILPSRVVADYIRRGHQIWLATPGRGGRPHKDSDVRQFRPDSSNIKLITEDAKTFIEQYPPGWVDQYRENWKFLGLPEVDSF